VRNKTCKQAPHPQRTFILSILGKKEKKSIFTKPRFGRQTSTGREASLSHDVTIACLACVFVGLWILLTSFLFSLETEVIIFGALDGAAPLSHFCCNKNVKFGNI
jgi:hypothetical protein